MVLLAILLLHVYHFYTLLLPTKGSKFIPAVFTLLLLLHSMSQVCIVFYSYIKIKLNSKCTSLILLPNVYAAGIMNSSKLPITSKQNYA